MDSSKSNSSSSTSLTDRIMASYKPKFIRLQPRLPPDPEYDELIRQHKQLHAYSDSYKCSVSRTRVMRFQVKKFFVQRFTGSHITSKNSGRLTPPIPLLSSLDLEEMNSSGTENQEITATKNTPPWDQNRNVVEAWLDDNSKNRKGGDVDYLQLNVPRMKKVYPVYFFNALKSFFTTDHSHAAEENENRRIRFPEEIEQKAAEMGDRAGKSREVKRSNWFRPQHRKHQSKFDKKRQRKVIDLDLGDEVDLTSKNPGCFKSLINKLMFGGSDVQHEAPTTTGNAKTKFSIAYRKAMTLFAANVESGGEFVEGNLITLNEADNIFKFPQSSEHTDKLNYVAAQLWMFAFAIHDLFKADSENVPTKSEFSKLIANFGILAEVSDEISVKMFTYSKLHDQHSSEWIAALKKIGGKRFTAPKIEPIESKIPTPGETLRLQKPSESNDKEAMQKFRIMAKLKSESSSSSPSSRWNKFNNFSKEDRLRTLAGLLDDCSEAINRIGTQVRFFIDDMESCKFEDEDLPMLTRLYLIDDLLQYISKSPETSKEHLLSLQNCIANFANDIRNLLERGQMFIVKVQEVNDMIQLCYEYMKSEYSVHLHIGLVETNKLLKAAAKTSDRQKKLSCLKMVKHCLTCGKTHELHYKPEQFFWTEFSDAFRQQVLTLPNVELMLRPPDDNSVHIEVSEIRFAKSSSNLGNSSGIGGGLKTEESDWKIERNFPVPKIERLASEMLKTSSSSDQTIELPPKSILKRHDQPEGAIAPGAFDIIDDEIVDEKEGGGSRRGSKDQEQERSLEKPKTEKPNTDEFLMRVEIVKPETTKTETKKVTNEEESVEPKSEIEAEKIGETKPASEDTDTHSKDKHKEA